MNGTGFPYMDPRQGEHLLVDGFKNMNDPERAGIDHHYLYDVDARGKKIVGNKVNPQPYYQRA